MAFTGPNQLLYGNHQAGSSGEDPEIAALRNEINNKIDRLAKNEDKAFIKDVFKTEIPFNIYDLTELKKAKEYVDALFEDYDTNIHYLHNIHAMPDNDGFLYFVNRKKSIDQKIDALSKTANHALDGVSLAVAMANLPTVSSEYNHNISVSYGTYAGSHSFALGLSGHIANDRLNYKLSGAINTKGNLAFGVGVGVNFGN
ncbi:YadA C-terminal domain-containing protein [uncultured Sneathia sp.]|uniref:YadA C-terminal domain-containing protein n=1 Tax=uncultured Sneathia sp. TaxID=278067 RepID=UPI002593F9FF|nr:YadA C-terminal domain-containing protein [uncultured Sneathia sp.]